MSEEKVNDPTNEEEVITPGEVFNKENAYEESKVGRAIVRRKVDTIIETGIKYRCRPIYDLLPVQKDIADKFAKELTLRFHLFNLSKMFCSNGTMNGYQYQRHLGETKCSQE